MATQVIEKLIDDLDGSGADETVTFALDGVLYTIDLSARNAAKLRKAFAPYLAAGEPVRPQPRQRTPIEDTTLGRAQIRAWARREGHFPNLGDRGRIPGDVIAAFRAATGRRYL